MKDATEKILRAVVIAILTVIFFLIVVPGAILSAVYLLIIILAALILAVPGLVILGACAIFTKCDWEKIDGVLGGDRRAREAKAEKEREAKAKGKEAYKNDERRDY